MQVAYYDPDYFLKLLEEYDIKSPEVQGAFSELIARQDIRPIPSVVTSYTKYLPQPTISDKTGFLKWLGPIGTGLDIVSKVIGFITSRKARKEAEERRKKQQALQMVNWLSNRFGRAGYGGGF